MRKKLSLLHYFGVMWVLAGVVIAIAGYGDTFAASSLISTSQSPHVESSADQELKVLPVSLPSLLRRLNIIRGTEPAATVSSATISPTTSFAVSSSVYSGVNLIANPSLETVGSDGLPMGWHKGGYGANTRQLTYPVTGHTGQGIQTSITAYTSGDAKWYFDDVPVAAGSEYRFSDYYKSNIQSFLTVRYRLSDGSFIYNDIATLAPNSVFTQTSKQFVVPANAVSATVFHLIKEIGTLTTDEYDFEQVSPPPPSDTSNLVSNGSFEQSDPNGLPTGWFKGGYGTNARSFIYPDTGVDGSRGAGVSITEYTSGDAKWYFAPVIARPGDILTYTNQYNSDTKSFLTVRFQMSDQSFTYKDLALLPSSGGAWAGSIVQFTVPADAVNMTVFHLIKSVGTLKIDNVALRKNLGGTSAGIFDTGAVSFSFDDGSLSQYQNAVPTLDNLGLKATFYIVTRQLSDQGFSGFVSQAQVRDLYTRGYEIGAHTRTHPHLPTLSFADQQTEINGSKNDLIAMGIIPMTFAYPYGEFDADTYNIAGGSFQSARATIDGLVDTTTDKLLLSRESVENTTTLADVKSWVGMAKANKQWLILTFHRVDTSGDQYSVTPSLFNQIANYVAGQNIPVVTVGRGIQDMNP